MSEIKVNKITPRTACGTTQLGDSGDTFTIPSGTTISNLGTATGFGGTGVVSWETGSIKTSGFTAATGTGYFCNTTSGGFTVTLPASPSAGDVVGVSDYAKTFDTGTLTLGRNSENIGGAAFDALLETEGLAVTLVYVDGTKGWIVTDSGNQSDAPTATYITASGGNTTITCGDYKTHIFTGPGTLCVSAVGNAAGSTSVDYLVVAGGGSGGTSITTLNGAAGGGAGGFRMSNGYCLPAPLTSPLAAPASLPVSVQGYPITVGAGGSAICGPSDSNGNNGSDTIFSSITSTGGGYGSGNADVGPVPGDGGPGGSGGGTFQNCAGTGNTPPTSPPQGQNGGGGATPSGAGGGGAGAVGGNAGPNTPSSGGGPGGDGSFLDDNAIGPTAPSYGGPGPASDTRYFAGGGGGANSPGRSPAGTVGTGGAGGGGASSGTSGGAGTVNTGGGGGGSSAAGSSGAGGSGIVIIRYKYQ